MLVLRVIILFLMCSHVTGQSYEARTRLQQDLLQNYTKFYRPLRNESDPLELTIHVYFGMVEKFDILAGVLGTHISFTLNWYDDYMQWNYSQYDNITVVKLPLADVWVPQLILKNPAGSNGLLNKQELMPYGVRYFATGLATLVFDAYLESICEPDIYYFPFDSHRCLIKIGTFGYDTDEVTNNNGTFDQYPNIDNGEWNVGEVFFGKNWTRGYVYLSLPLSRHPYQLCLNLVIPIFILIGMNLLTFYVPPESGEKTSFSITVFLAMTIYMTIIMDRLPSSNDENVSFLNTFLFCLICINAMVCVCTVISVYWYHSSEKIPITHLGLYNITNVVIRIKGNAITRYSSDDRRLIKLNEDKCIPVNELTWTILSRVFDFLIFWYTLFFVSIYVVIFIVVLARGWRNRE